MLMWQPCRRCEPPAQTGYCDFCSGVGAHPIFTCKGMKPGRAVNAISVQQGHGRHTELGSALDKIFRQRCPLKKTESAGCMKLDILLSHTTPLPTSLPA